MEGTGRSLRLQRQADFGTASTTPFCSTTTTTPPASLARLLATRCCIYHLPCKTYTGRGNKEQHYTSPNAKHPHRVHAPSARPAIIDSSSYVAPSDMQHGTCDMTQASVNPTPATVHPTQAEAEAVPFLPYSAQHSLRSALVLNHGLATRSLHTWPSCFPPTPSHYSPSCLPKLPTSCPQPQAPFKLCIQTPPTPRNND